MTKTCRLLPEYARCSFSCGFVQKRSHIQHHMTRGFWYSTGDHADSSRGHLRRAYVPKASAYATCRYLLPRWSCLYMRTSMRTYLRPVSFSIYLERLLAFPVFSTLVFLEVCGVITVCMSLQKIVSCPCALLFILGLTEACRMLTLPVHIFTLFSVVAAFATCVQPAACDNTASTVASARAAPASTLRGTLPMALVTKVQLIMRK